LSQPPHAGRSPPYQGLPTPRGCLAHYFFVGGRGPGEFVRQVSRGGGRPLPPPPPIAACRPPSIPRSAADRACCSLRRLRAPSPRRPCRHAIRRSRRPRSSAVGSDRRRARSASSSRG